jgi:hypothetical protein
MVIKKIVVFNCTSDDQQSFFRGGAPDAPPPESAPTNGFQNTNKHIITNIFFCMKLSSQTSENCK